MSTSLSTIRLDVEDGVANITLDNPPVNAISAVMMQELRDVCGSSRAVVGEVGMVPERGSADVSFSVSRRLAIAIAAGVLGSVGLLTGCSTSARYERLHYWSKTLGLRDLGKIVDEDVFGSNNLPGSPPTLTLVERGDLARIVERAQGRARDLGFVASERDRVWVDTSERETASMFLTDFTKGKRWSFEGRHEIVTSEMDSVLITLVVATL